MLYWEVLTISFIIMNPSLQSQIFTQQECLSKQLDDLTQKVADLANKHLSLQSSVKSVPSQFADHASSMKIDVPMQSVVWVPNSALDIVDEMSDRERRKFKIVVYNFSEGTDRKANIKAFQTLSMDVFKLDLGIVKAVHLGPKIANKHRPLLLTVNELNDKNYLISHSHFLRRHEKFNKVFVVPDRTKLERLKHKNAVEELKQRCAKG